MRHIFNYTDVYFVYLYYRLLHVDSVSVFEVKKFIEWLENNSVFLLTSNNNSKSVLDFVRGYKSLFAYDSYTDNITLNVDKMIMSLNDVAYLMHGYDEDVSLSLTKISENEMNKRRDDAIHKLDDVACNLDSVLLDDLVCLSSRFNSYYTSKRNIRCKIREKSKIIKI